MSDHVLGRKLIIPNTKMVEVFNEYWTQTPSHTEIKLYEDGDCIDVTKYIEEFSIYEKEDQSIFRTEDLKDFLNKINQTYHTRVTGISQIVEEMSKRGIHSKNDLKLYIEKRKLSVPQFTGICKEATGSYTYSFATKVFSFIDESFPIVDSIVATLLNEYEYEGKITPKSKWGDYSLYVKNYEAFQQVFGLEKESRKRIDKFLWTYGKILEAYWVDLGVLRFDPVSFAPGTIE